MSSDLRRRLGQYFTPVRLIDFALDALAWLDPQEPTARSSRRLVDPACGPGEFIARALEKGLVVPGNAYGLDKDRGMTKLWIERGLAVGPQGPWLEVADGLLADAVCGRPLTAGSFNWVVGNPPYAGWGLKNASRSELELIAQRYDMWRLRFRHPPGPEALRRLPIEVLFAERFWRLCRPNGLIAVILPVGIFANQRWQFVRQRLIDPSRATLHAVVGLPRSAFRAGGITAKTCLALIGKRPAPHGHKVLLAEVDRLDDPSDGDQLAEVLQAWRDGREVARPTQPWRHGASD